MSAKDRMFPVGSLVQALVAPSAEQPAIAGEWIDATVREVYELPRRYGVMTIKGEHYGYVREEDVRLRPEPMAYQVTSDHYHRLTAAAGLGGYPDFDDVVATIERKSEALREVNRTLAPTYIGAGRTEADEIRDLQTQLGEARNEINRLAANDRIYGRLAEAMGYGGGDRPSLDELLALVRGLAGPARPRGVGQVSAMRDARDKMHTMIPTEDLVALASQVGRLTDPTSLRKAPSQACGLLAEFFRLRAELTDMVSHYSDSGSPSHSLAERVTRLVRSLTERVQALQERVSKIQAMREGEFTREVTASVRTLPPYDPSLGGPEPSIMSPAGQRQSAEFMRKLDELLISRGVSTDDESSTLEDITRALDQRDAALTETQSLGESLQGATNELGAIKDVVDQLSVPSPDATVSGRVHTLAWGLRGALIRAREQAYGSDVEKSLGKEWTFEELLTIAKQLGQELNFELAKTDQSLDAAGFRGQAGDGRPEPHPPIDRLVDDGGRVIHRVYPQSPQQPWRYWDGLSQETYTWAQLEGTWTGQSS